ncbi:MAG TPA: NAD-dependent deacylase [Candidatus Polarisedimenticolia bacterium]|nr:NAD-dependent deacylase [Candidatus Polarisedimenticolia bacterium]
MPRVAAPPPLEIPEALRDALRACRHVVVLTGAGMSAESGLPTFREPLTGLWAKYRPEELATPQAFRRDPRLVWEWYEWRRGLVAGADPNPGHYALVELERRVPSLTLLTQNVDGLHARAGSRDVVELHGNIGRSKCFDRHHPAATWSSQGAVPPRCGQCGSLLRPDVVWFGESLPVAALQAAQLALEECDLFLSIGTSGSVQPAASFSFHARAAGARVAIINPEWQGPTDPEDFLLRGRSGEVLPALVRSAWPERERAQ